MIEINLNERIEHYIEHVFYYVEHPKGVEEKFWKDREGNFHFIPEMETDHLIASLKLINKDIESFKKQQNRKSSFYDAISQAIFPLAKTKSDELKKEINKRTSGI